MIRVRVSVGHASAKLPKSAIEPRAGERVLLLRVDRPLVVSPSLNRHQPYSSLFFFFFACGNGKASLSVTVADDRRRMLEGTERRSERLSM